MKWTKAENNINEQRIVRRDTIILKIKKALNQGLIEKAKKLAEKGSQIVDEDLIEKNNK